MEAAEVVARTAWSRRDIETETEEGLIFPLRSGQDPVEKRVAVLVGLSKEDATAFVATLRGVCHAATQSGTSLAFCALLQEWRDVHPSLRTLLQDLFPSDDLWRTIEDTDGAQSVAFVVKREGAGGSSVVRLPRLQEEDEEEEERTTTEIDLSLVILRNARRVGSASERLLGDRGFCGSIAPDSVVRVECSSPSLPLDFFSSSSPLEADRLPRSPSLSLIPPRVLIPWSLASSSCASQKVWIN